jgi:hypothetical protein
MRVYVAADGSAPRVVRVSRGEVIGEMSLYGRAALNHGSCSARLGASAAAETLRALISIIRRSATFTADDPAAADGARAPRRIRPVTIGLLRCPRVSRSSTLRMSFPRSWRVSAA